MRNRQTALRAVGYFLKVTAQTRKNGVLRPCLAGSAEAACVQEV